jgi:nucleoside-diphosphate kinase
MVKPDGVRRGLIGEVVGRLERKGLRLIRARMLTIDAALAARHYAEHVGKAFYPDLEAFITSGPVFAMEWEGEEAVEVARALMGVTDPKKAAPGTIRGDFGLVTTENIVHGSDSPASAARELGLFFG